jgi:hypothetical protein
MTSGVNKKAPFGAFLLASRRLFRAGFFGFANLASRIFDAANARAGNGDGGCDVSVKKTAQERRRSATSQRRTEGTGRQDLD